LLSEEIAFFVGLAVVLLVLIRLSPCNNIGPHILSAKVRLCRKMQGARLERLFPSGFTIDIIPYKKILGDMVESSRPYI
jgi:hypothetical protein